eukprot:TRINITY_DN709_c0_g1_i1.p1 TRINITY_DN709_c0_g1~~TRINITY_DN709_c0_g1_i1.p1  ORF type:complete len:206 (-),score=34.74 TRINITY_DN709_c0_g1_i1:95-712(-)
MADKALCLTFEAHVYKKTKCRNCGGLETAHTFLDFQQLPSEVLASILAFAVGKEFRMIAKVVRVNKLFSNCLGTQHFWWCLSQMNWRITPRIVSSVKDWKAFAKKRFSLLKQDDKGQMFIENCLVAEFECPLTYQSLRTIDGKSAYCDRCKEKVYRCFDVEDLVSHIEQGHCVAFETSTLKTYAEKDRIGMPYDTSIPRPRMGVF